MSLTVKWMPRPRDEDFALAAPLLQVVVDKAVQGEFTLNDLRERAARGACLIGVALRDGEPVMAAALELVHYPQFTTVNVMALGGAGLAEVAGAFFDGVKDFARSAGARHIEADCSPLVARLLKDVLGFMPTYEKVRYAL